MSHTIATLPNSQLLKFVGIWVLLTQPFKLRYEHLLMVIKIISIDMIRNRTSNLVTAYITF